MSYNYTGIATKPNLNIYETIINIYGDLGQHTKPIQTLYSSRAQCPKPLDSYSKSNLNTSNCSNSNLNTSNYSSTKHILVEFTLVIRYATEPLEFFPQFLTSTSFLILASQPFLPLVVGLTIPLYPWFGYHLIQRLAPANNDNKKKAPSIQDDKSILFA